MRNRLETSVRQQLRLKPGMHQVVQLLTLTNAELATHLDEVLAANPLLEVADQTDDIVQPSLEDAPDFDEVDDPFDRSDAVSAEGLDVLGLDPSTQIDGDVEWDEENSYDSPEQAIANSESFAYEPAQTEHLSDHLVAQIRTESWSELEQNLVRTLIYALDEHGFLAQKLSNIVVDSGIEAEQSKWIDALQRLQGFDPSGVGARNLRESLLIQLGDVPDTSDCRELAIELVRDYFDEVSTGREEYILEAAQIDAIDWHECKHLIASLQPYPAAAFKSNEAHYVMPDVIVSLQHGRWVVEMPDDQAPTLRITPHRALYEAEATSSEERKYIAQQIEQAEIILEGLNYRRSLVLRTANAIVVTQQDFFEKGEAAMRPLIRADLAAQLGVHESAISRVASRKYMATPKGVFPFSYFFSAKVARRSGGSVSATAIKARLRLAIANEDPRHPMSDAKLVELLSKQDVRIARRTVAKYREALSIPSASQRAKLVANA